LVVIGLDLGWGLQWWWVGWFWFMVVDGGWWVGFSNGGWIGFLDGVVVVAWVVD